jgi:Putative phage metallopeptidase
MTGRLAIVPTLARPLPPEPLRSFAFAPDLEDFAPDRAAWDWIRATFLEAASPLVNPEHAHLRQAHVGILWTNVGNHRQMRTILGTAEIPMARGGRWAKARHDLQLRQWFGAMPDFVVTLSAPFCATADDASFCALVEHELYHCAQDVNAFGVPKFSRSTGRPLFAMRDHDVGEFVGVVRRYGAAATRVQELVLAGSTAPTIDVAKIGAACGYCLRAA